MESKQIIEMDEMQVFGDAVLSNTTNLTELYFTHAGTEIAVSMETEFKFRSKVIDPKTLDNGTKGNLYWDAINSVCTRVEITVLQEKRSAEEEYKEMPRVFLRHRHPTNVLKSQCSNPKEQALIDVIEPMFPALRKVSHTESVWIAFGVAYLEHLARANDPAQVKAFLHLISSTPGNFPVFRELGNLPSDQFFEWLESKGRDDRGFGAALVKMIKELALYHIRLHPEELFLAYDSIEQMQEELSNDLHQMNDADFSYLSKVLNVHLCIISLGNEPPWKRTIKYEHDQPKQRPRLYLLAKNGDFSILYSKAQLAAEGYDLKTYSRRDENRQQVDQYLYKKPSVPLQLQSETWEQELAAQRKSTKLISDAVGAVHNFIKMTLVAIDKWRLLLDIPFFSNDGKIALSTGYEKLLKSFEPQPKNEELAQIQVQVMTIPNLTKLLNDTLRLCGKCGQQPGEVNLGCHKFCKVCFEKYEDEQLEHFFTSTSMVCPMASCSRAIPLEVFKKVVNNKKYQYSEKLWLENTQSLRCSICHLALPCETVYDLDCTCNLCLYCLANILRSSHLCLCRQPIPEPILNYMRSYAVTCLICGVARNLVSHFPPVKCQSHSICKICWNKLILDPAPRCPSCVKLFSTEEQQLVTVSLQETCVKCKKLCSDMLETRCLCTICKKCTPRYLQDVEPWQCPCCKQETTEQSAMELIFWSKKKQSSEMRRP